MQDRDIEYCNFRETTAMVMTWNAGAATPTHLRYEERDSRFFHELLQANSPPDLLVFGFQELVDLEDKKLTASTYTDSSTKNTADVSKKHYLEATAREIQRSQTIWPINTELGETTLSDVSRTACLQLNLTTYCTLQVWLASSVASSLRPPREKVYGMSVQGRSSAAWVAYMATRWVWSYLCQWAIYANVD